MLEAQLVLLLVQQQCQVMGLGPKICLPMAEKPRPTGPPLALVQQQQPEGVTGSLISTYPNWNLHAYNCRHLFVPLALHQGDSQDMHAVSCIPHWPQSPHCRVLS